MSDIEHRIERAIHEGEEVLTGALGDPPNEEAWADLADQVIGDLADDYRGAVEALEQIRDAGPSWPLSHTVAEKALRAMNVDPTTREDG